MGFTPMSANQDFEGSERAHVQDSFRSASVLPFLPVVFRNTGFFGPLGSELTTDTLQKRIGSESLGQRSSGLYQLSLLAAITGDQ